MSDLDPVAGMTTDVGASTVRAPREIHLRTEPPKTASGKVDKKALRAAIAAG